MVETEVLALGLNFAVTLNTLPTTDFITGIEGAAGKLTPEMAHDLKTEVTEYLIKKERPTSHLGKQHREALNKLQKDDTIVILLAHKGNVTVMMEKTDYQKEMEELLQGGSYKTERETHPQKLRRK